MPRRGAAERFPRTLADASVHRIDTQPIRFIPGNSCRAGAVSIRKWHSSPPHPLLIHFPIALVIAAALAEVVAMVTADERWRTVAVANVRAGAGFALLATIAGWRLALAPDMEVSRLLEWHRWLGTVASGAAFAAALATGGVRVRSALGVRTYRIALFGAGTLVAVAGHFGGLLVWGADFLHP